MPQCSNDQKYSFLTHNRVATTWDQAAPLPSPLSPVQFPDQMPLIHINGFPPPPLHTESSQGSL